MVLELEDILNTNLGNIAKYSISQNFAEFLENVDLTKFSFNIQGGFFPVLGKFEIDIIDEIQFIEHTDTIEYIGIENKSKITSNNNKSNFYYMPSIFYRPFIPLYEAKKNSYKSMNILNPLFFIPRYIQQLENKKNSEKLILADLMGFKYNV